MLDLLNNNLHSGDRIVIIKNGKIISQKKRVIFKSGNNEEVQYGFISLDGKGSGHGTLNLKNDNVSIAKFKKHYSPKEKMIISQSLTPKL